MAYDGNGVFNRLYNWQADAAAGINILALRMDNEMDGFATGLSTCLTRDGQAAMEAPLDMGGFKMINLANPTNPQDAVTKNFLDSNFAAYLQVGPTAPATPKMGSLWYKDTVPVGLYMWYVDVDSSQWIMLAGQGIPLPIATQAEAVAGTRNDVLMTPLRVDEVLTATYATQAEAKTGTATDKIMSPALVRYVGTEIKLASGTFDAAGGSRPWMVPTECFGFEWEVDSIVTGASGSALMLQVGSGGTNTSNTTWVDGTATYQNIQAFNSSGNASQQVASTAQLAAFLTGALRSASGAVNFSSGKAIGFNAGVAAPFIANHHCLCVVDVAGVGYNQMIIASARSLSNGLWNAARLLSPPGVISGNYHVKGLLK